MDNVTSFEDRSRCFEDAHRTCREVLGGRIKKIETFAGKWLPIAIGVLFLAQILGFVFFYFAYVDVLKKVDHRYFQIIESLEDIHKVQLNKGRLIRDFKRE